MADRGQVARAVREPPELAHEDVVAEEVGDCDAAGDEKEIAAFDLGQPPRSGEDEAPVRFDRSAGRRGDHHGRVGDSGKYGVRPCEIQLGHAGIDRLDDQKVLCGHCGASDGFDEGSMGR